MRKILVATATGVSCFIANPSLSNSNFDGFYIGAAAGYSSLDGREKTSGKTPDFDDYDVSSNIKSNNISGKAFAGYGHSINNKWHIDYELFIEYGNQEAKFNHRVDSNWTSEKFSSKFSGGFVIMPGYLLKPDILLSLKLGAKASQFTFKAVDNYEPQNAAHDHMAFTKKSVLPGITLGGVLKTHITEKTSLRVDVDYTKFRTFKAAGQSNNDHTLSAKIKPNTTTITVGLSYKL